MYEKLDRYLLKVVSDLSVECKQGIERDNILHALCINGTLPEILKRLKLKTMSRKSLARLVSNRLLNMKRQGRVSYGNLVGWRMCAGVFTITAHAVKEGVRQKVSVMVFDEVSEFTEKQWLLLKSRLQNHSKQSES